MQRAGSFEGIVDRKVAGAVLFERLVMSTVGS